MTMESLDERLHLLRQRRQTQQGAVSDDQAHVKVELASELARLTEEASARFCADAAAMSDRVTRAHAAVDVLNRSIKSLENHASDLSARVVQAESHLRHWQRRVLLAGVVIAALAAVIIAAALFSAAQMRHSAKDEVARLRAAQADELMAAQKEGEAAIADLRADLDRRRAELQSSLDNLGGDLAALTSHRDAVRAELETFINLRDEMGFTLIDYHSGPVIVVPEGEEIRHWGAPGLSSLARYNGRMYRVMAERK